MNRLRATFAFLLLVLTSSTGLAGLRDIIPRPQQMGYVTDVPVPLSGALYVVFPNDTVPGESVARAEFLRIIGQRLGTDPIAIPWSQFNGQHPSIWVGTTDHFPDLQSALSATGIAGLGATEHEEEYQLYVGDDRVYALAHDLPGMRWSALSLVKLIGEIYGQFYVDRVYIRDWPDFPRRVNVINSPMRNQAQLDYCNQAADSAYLYKMSDVEWNDGDAGRSGRTNFYINSSRAFRRRLSDRGQQLYMSVDRTGNKIENYSWSEAIPSNGTRMTVTSSGFVPIATGFNITIPNSGFESWTGGRPTGWTMYRDSLFDYVSQDNVTRHSGSSSLKMTGFHSTTSRLTLREAFHAGVEKWVSIKFWYKTSGFTGNFRVMAKSINGVSNDCLMQSWYVGTNLTQDWTQFSLNFPTFEFDSLELQFGPEDPRAGTIWFDDITIETANPLNMVRRSDTPLRVYEEPAHTLRLEGTDYQVVETYSTNYTNFVRAPRLERISGGALAVNDVVSVDWSCAFFFQLTRETVCLSRLEPLEEYQQRVRNLDSLLSPDGIKIHINELSFSNYDIACTSRGLSCGQLVGSYCNSMFNIIQSQRPNSPVRIYGDAFDTFVVDPRANPAPALPWEAGALQQLDPSIEVMAMTDYTTDIDSSLIYFASHGNPALVAAAGGNSFDSEVFGAQAARRHPNVIGMEFYTWNLADYAELTDFSGLCWNFGPFIIHSSPEIAGPADSVEISAEIWSDLFRSSVTPYLTETSVMYRWLPSTTWHELTMAPVGPDAFQAMIPPGGGGATSLEYYITATDHREQTSTSPADAPLNVYQITFGSSSAPGAVEPFSLLTPSSGDTVFSSSANLVWQSTSDPDPYDLPHYDLWMDTLADLSTAWLCEASVADTIASMMELQDNQSYFWHVRATDSNSPGIWANEPFSFVAYVPDAPSSFNLLSPNDSVTLSVPQFTVNWNRATDPDEVDSLTYVIEWSPEPGFSPLYSGTTADTFYLISDLSARMQSRESRRNNLDDLPDDSPVYWRVRAEDRYGLSAWSESDTSGRVVFIGIPENPEPFDLLLPANLDSVSSQQVNLEWNPAADPDPGDTPLYDVWLDTLANLSTANRIATSLATAHFVATICCDNRDYYWTVHAQDANSEGVWSVDTLSFHSYFPERPLPFHLFSPENNGQQHEDQIVFVWTASTDKDPGDAVNYVLDLIVDSTLLRFDAGTDTTFSVSQSEVPIEWSEIQWQVEAHSLHPDFTLRSEEQFNLFPAVLTSGAFETVPTEYYFNQNFPNPFNSSTTIEFGLPVSTSISIRVHDILGREVEPLAEGVWAAGRHSITWNCSECSSGTYLLVMTTREFSVVKRAIFLK